ncbi:sulfate transporter [Lingula anatina]|uniref:Sulfate transporter n=1 Tax=Lingula anatina TaxID=7574 RepID=A0A1S3I529_LINAN|nr:sulfate transporter [Lingula anatina]XP_013393368.1 sulfate transporter [Lingula anatina]XP_013393370.1 sulfate transporter [Lingula anatina]XP_013393371.1 sulfate transporter [Lingula anatina]XP_013393372.1 sulfate transporter [Lingula anatina]|eukprot:XP_013393367.1 sulfate transporter [Lingula anatina]
MKKTAHSGSQPWLPRFGDLDKQSSMPLLTTEELERKEVQNDKDSTPVKMGSTSGQGNGHFNNGVTPHGHGTHEILTMEAFHQQHQPEFPTFSAKTEIKKKIAKNCTGSKDCVLKVLFTLFPFLNVLRTYKIREYLVGDIVSGLSVGVLHIAQGMGFGLLASLQPIHGLYSSFFPVLLYFIFGTSRHISFGTMALTAILVAEVVDREYPKFIDPMTLDSNLSLNATVDGGTMDDEILEVKVGIAMALTLLCGIIQVGMGIFRLGFVTTYLSDAFVGGFTTGAAFHITTSQVKTMLGLKIKGFSGPFMLILTYVEVFKNIAKTNILSLVISALCIIVIISVKICINQRFSHKLKVPIPIDLIIMIIMTLVSHFANLNANFGVAVIGSVPQGFPPPRVPPLEHAGNFAVESLVLAIVGFAISISMAKVFTVKYHYQLDNNQELLAYGLSNGISSFFRCFVSAVAPPRCMLHDSTGGKTMVHSVVSAILVFIVIMAISPLLVSVPKCVLASIIVAAMQKLLMQFEHLPALWRVSACDFFIWLVTWLAVVVLDISMGLGIGLGFSFITVVIRTQFAKGFTLTKTDGMDNFVSAQHYPEIKDLSSSSIKIFQFQSALYFANVELFKDKLFKLVGKPEEEKTDGDVEREMKEVNGSPVANGKEDEVDGKGDVDSAQKEDGILTSVSSSTESINQFVLIIDCARIVFIDSAGIKCLRLLYNEYKSLGITVFMAGCTEEVYLTLQNGNFFDTFPPSNVFMSLQDAYDMALSVETGDRRQDQNDAPCQTRM